MIRIKNKFCDKFLSVLIFWLIMHLTISKVVNSVATKPSESTVMNYEELHEFQKQY
jgi:hypothetical protein